VFAPGRVTLHRIIGAVLLYLNIGFTFVALYCFVALIAPHAFVGISPRTDNLGVAANFGYFSFVTLTSVGYGDIVPLHPYARSLANVEAIIGQLYPATLLARLVTLEIADRQREPTNLILVIWPLRSVADYYIYQCVSSESLAEQCYS